MWPGPCASDANAAKGSRLGYFASGHNVSINIPWKSGACWLIQTPGLLLAASPAWPSLV